LPLQRSVALLLQNLRHWAAPATAHRPRWTFPLLVLGATGFAAKAALVGVGTYLALIVLPLPAGLLIVVAVTSHLAQSLHQLDTTVGDPQVAQPY
jgi:hypothetical protein